MILKKPYAFLIRHFRLIHLILSIPIIYLTRKSRLLVNFFNTYVSNNYSFQTGSDISSLYIGLTVLFATFVIIVASLTIYYLLKYKEKPVKMYVFMIIYYVILFMVLIWLSNIISGMSRTVLEAKTARVYRDISILLYFPQYIFVAFTVLRAVGFNIKQMNFQSDLKEMEITSADNEEVEVGFEIDGYKTKRFFRRFKREFSYYIAENKLMISVSLIIILFSSIYVFYNTRKSYDKTYRQNSSFMYNGFTINVEDSIITNLTNKGNKFEDTYYIALKLKVKNNMNVASKLQHTSFVVEVGNKQITPTLDRSTYFLDYGNPYFGEEIGSTKEKEVVLVYEIDKKDIKKSFKLKLLTDYKVRNDKLVTTYANVNLTPVIIEDVSNIKTVSVNNKINFTNTNVGNTILNITDYYMGTSYMYEYQVCYSDDNCVNKKDIANIDYRKSGNTATLLVLGYDFDLDKSTSYANYRKKDSYFFEDFMTVHAGVNGEYKDYDVINVTPKNLSNKLVLQVNGSIGSADDLDVYVTIRNKRYIINLI